MVNVDDAIIARLESYGEKFEILVDADLAADFSQKYRCHQLGAGYL